MTNGIDDILAPLDPIDPRETAGCRLLAQIGEGGMGTVYLSHTHQDGGDSDLRFLTPMGRSTGTTPEACRTGVDTDALPAAIPGDDNLAMLRITDVLPDAKQGLSSDMPDYVTTLTL
ncbi:hypothetical protein ACFWVU_34955 [Streptomyces sp. NPDC058686]|uniref:hypothetical protein n=1 Tax=Streptomyces sp. NPDC058686 TaxID=3346599 RepID=UPI0036569DF5